MAAQITSLVGQTIGKYKLVEVLGSGGMAQVYRAIQMPLERSVAFKVLHPHLTEQTDLRDRFLREAKAIASLRHPNIVHVYDFECLDGICYMAMEFLDGVSLEDQLEGLAIHETDPVFLPLSEALEIVVQIAEALDFAHRQGIVHRDVKPGNIMRTLDGRVVLTDFGIATVLHETRLTVEGGTSGTPSYMSPEQAMGERGEKRSDIYSLGAALYHFVTGRLPFEADTTFGLIMKHISESPLPASQVNPQVPLSVEQVIAKAMEKNLADRYQTAQEFAADLQAILKGESVEVKLSKKPNRKITETFTTLARNRSKYAWVAVVIALLIVLFIARAINTQSIDLQTPSASDSSVDSMAAKPDTGVDSMTASTFNQPIVEDFSSNTLNWLISDGPISRQLVDGAYQVSIETSNKAIASYPDDSYMFYDFIYQAEATLLERQPESGYGLIFRRQDNQNYYVFGINGLGQWSIWRLDDGVWHELRDLPGETWTPAEAILRQGNLNFLKVEANGSRFNLFVNDQLLTEQPIVDETFTSGGIGLYVASSQTVANALARVQFDNIVLTPLSSDDTGIPSMTSDNQ